MCTKQVVLPAALCATLLLLAACGRENVKSSYLGTASMSEDQVTQMLNNNGYQSITSLHKNGQDWVGSATKDGTPVNFDIDKSGTVHTK